MLLFDAHLDLSLNAINFNRDLNRSISEIREVEAGMTDIMCRGGSTVNFTELRRAEIGVCVATQLAHCKAGDTVVGAWRSPEIAWSITQAQLVWYRTMEEAGQMKQIVDRDGLNRHVELWKNGGSDDAPIGYILSLEGADSLITLDYLDRAYEYGLRALGPAHFGVGRYSPGTFSEGKLTSEGVELVKKMSELGMILDATHLTDEAFWHALEIFDGPVWASHNNCRALVNHQRQFSDEQFKALIERGAVIGSVFDAWMLYPPGWVRGETVREESGVTIATVVDHVDHLCQLAGNARHCGIGSDLDGGFGTQQCPQDLDTIADLQKLPEIFASRGYSAEDIEGLFHGNWLRFLNEAWS